MREPAMCEYEGWVKTPAACSYQVLRRRYDDFLEMATKEGLSYEVSPKVQALFDRA